MKSHPKRDGFFIHTMFGKVKFLVYYFLAWIIFFQLARLLFLAYHFQKVKVVGWGTACTSLIYGLRMDLSMAAYIALPVCLFTIGATFIPFLRKATLYICYTGLLLFAITLLTGADLELYRQWGYRIDVTPLRYFNTPKEVWASISHLPLLLITVMYLFVLLLLIRTSDWFIKKHIQLLHIQFGKRILISLILVLVFTVGLIIPLRGGLQLAPMNQSAVYFSNHLFANHAALNASWNFMHSLKNSSVNTTNPYVFFESEKAELIVDSLYQSHDETSISLLNTSQPNVLLIIWESFTSKALQPYLGKSITPYFDRLKAEGVFFENIYASGDRTDKGLAAVLSGYPALPSSSIIRTPAKSAQLNLLSTLLNKAGYKSSFYYGGETEFANIKSYLIQGDFDPIIDKNQFSKKDQNSKWGVHDGIVAQQILKNTHQLQQPFFLTWLTLSSHEPYEIPEPALINSNDNTAKFLSSIHYTDKSLYQFLQQSKLQSWWANTLVIIIGDHGHPLPETGNQVDNFKIPMLWLGGALRQQNIIIDKVASQTDLATTLAKQLGQNASYFPYSRDIMKANADKWALFRFNDGFGWVKPDGYLIYDNIGKQIVKQEGKMDRQNIIIGQALQQVYYEDFLKR